MYNPGSIVTRPVSDENRCCLNIVIIPVDLSKHIKESVWKFITPAFHQNAEKTVDASNLYPGDMGRLVLVY